MRINVDWLPINFANFVAIHPKTDLLTGKTNYYSRELKAWWNMFTKHRVWSHPSSTVSTWPSSWLNPLSSLISSHCWLCIFHIYFQSPLLHQFVPPVKHVSHFFLWFCCQYHVISILSSSHWPSPLANLVAFSITVIKSSGLRADPWIMYFHSYVKSLWYSCYCFHPWSWFLLQRHDCSLFSTVCLHSASSIAFLGTRSNAVSRSTRTWFSFFFFHWTFLAIAS